MNHPTGIPFALFAIALVGSASGQQPPSSDLRTVDAQVSQWIEATAKRNPSRLATEYARRISLIKQGSPSKRLLYEAILIGFAAEWALPKQRELDEAFQRHALVFAGDSSYEAQKARLLLQGTGWGTTKSVSLANKLIAERPDDDFVVMAALRPSLSSTTRQRVDWVLSTAERLKRSHREYVFLWYVSAIGHIWIANAPGSDRKPALRDVINDFQYFLDHTAGRTMFRDFAQFQVAQKRNELLAK